jgi:small subunit ribosomal protein S9
MAIKPTTTIGRRKTSSARVIINVANEDSALKVADKETATGIGNGEQIIVNGKFFAEYFPRATAQLQVVRPLQVTESLGKFSFQVLVNGGGPSGQVGAVVLGMARAIQKLHPELRAVLKSDGLLTRDQRAVERKHPGRKKARKRFQFSKR